MKKFRIIPKLDVKGPNVIKSIQFECLRVVGDPATLAQKYEKQGADEIIYIDTVAHLYNRGNLLNVVRQATKNISIPFTAGGGVRTIADIEQLLKAGAEKVAINTAATKNPELIREAARRFGSQCIVVSINAKDLRKGSYGVYTDKGRENSGMEVVAWAKQVEELGAGEILLTSIDQDGSERGFDITLIKQVTDAVSIPVIACGGAGTLEDIETCVKESGADAISLAAMLHYERCGVHEVKQAVERGQALVRKIPEPLLSAFTPFDEEDYIQNPNQFTLRHLKRKHLEEEKLAQDHVEADDEDFTIGIISCGINNSKSVLAAFKKLGRKAKVLETPEQATQAKALIIPGVGAFEAGMRSLEEKGFLPVIKERAAKGTPILGICLGMQLLFSESEEFGVHKGLDLIPGRVVSLKSKKEVVDPQYRLPHIGWNTFKIKKQSHLFADINEENDDVYYVHSFHCNPENQEHILATTTYGGQEFCSITRKDNIVGHQFHPEKSSEVGHQLLKNFCEEFNL